MNILVWLLLGLVAGALAKFIMTGKQGGGIIMTIILGIVGAMVGGWLGQNILGIGETSGFNVATILTAVVGALIVLFIYGLVTKKR